MTKDMKEFLKMMHDDIRERNIVLLGEGYSIVAEDSDWFNMLRPYCECDDEDLDLSISQNVAYIFVGQYDDICPEFIEIVQLWRDDHEEEMEVCV